MCGIAGWFESNPRRSPQALEHLVLAMCETIRHRGPDDGGAWVDAIAGVALGMRRLSILDLSPAGSQPMHSVSGRYVVVFNGEIYNFEELRCALLAEVPRLAFRGHSDTEVMLAAFERWGIEGSVRRFNGMFAFAVWDREERRLTLGRDRFGEKPLYYYFANGRLLFASELKALKVHPDFPAEIDGDAIALYLRHNCIPAPYSIYKNTHKLPPATLLTIRSDDSSFDPKPYWSLRDVAESGINESFAGSEAESLETLDTLLRDAIRIRMVSDVPLGAFLSGGVDSSVIVSLMQAQSGVAVKTFSIGFREADYNEAADAARVAHHLQTEHTELCVTPSEALAVVPRLAQMYDEPFADSSQIPTFLVAKLARSQVTVSLSGDGGDELFGGYNRHTWIGPLWRKLGPVPISLRRFGAAAITTLPPRFWDNLYAALSPALSPGWRQRMPGYKLHKLATIMASSTVHEMYLGLTSHWLNPQLLMPNAVEVPTLLTNGRRAHLPTAAEEMMYLDAMTYLPDDILVKVDRATMAVSLEGRIPFLDHRIAEFAWKLPLSLRIRGRQGKWIVRQLLYRYVPRELVDRPKSGFGIPLGAWLRGPLRDWAEALLDEGRLRREGWFNPMPIRNAWHEHLAGRRPWEYQLWDVLMFQAWLEENSRQPAYATAPAGGQQSMRFAQPEVR